MIKNVLLPVIILTVIVGMSSCKQKAAVPPADPQTGKFNFGLLRYDSAALEYRLDSIHNRGLVFQFLITHAADNNTNFQLISYAFDTLGDYNNSWLPDTLRTITDSVPRTFEGRMVLGNTEITREQLYDVVRTPDGKRFSYDYMLFTPVLEGVFNHVVYRIRPIKNGRPAPGNNEKMQMTTCLPPARVWP
jgi:hypothetical protein